MTSQDLKYISDEVKEQYLDNFSLALEGFIKAVPNLDYVQKRSASFDYVKPIIELSREIQNVLYFLSYRRNATDKRGISELNDINPEEEQHGLGIDPTYSGYPNAEWMRILYILKEEIPQLRKQLPPKKQVLDSAVQSLFEQATISRSDQELYLRHKFFDELEQKALPDRSKGMRVSIKGNDSVEVNSIFQFLSPKDNIFQLISATYQVAPKLWKKIEDTAEEIDFILNSIGDLDAYNSFLALRNYENDFRPKQLDRLVIGPYIDVNTEKTVELEPVFASSTNPFLLNIKFEEVHSEKSMSHSELASNMSLHQYAICPFKIKKAMEILFKLTTEKLGYSSNIIGITDKGDICD